MSHKVDDVAHCRDCRESIRLGQEKALGREWQTVWVDTNGAWICPVTGNEHRPDTEPVTVFLIDGDKVRPTPRQRVGILLINLGGWLLKGSVPNVVEYRRTKPPTA